MNSQNTSINRLWNALLIFAALFLSAAPSAQANQFEATTPTSDFTLNGDTVTHNITGLTWKRCAEGMTWTGSTCSGAAKTYTWAEANALTAGGWRLPTIAELVTLVERETYNPAINTTVFPGTPASDFWSASANANNSDNAWYVNFYTGYDYTNNKSSSYSVRLVRGGQLLDSSGRYTPTSDFSDNGDGSVTHKKTSLTWKRCAEEQTWTGTTCSGTAKSYTWSAANALSSGGWRLPTQNELQTLVEYSIAYPGPTINTTIFPNTPASDFWSASAYAFSSDHAWNVFFNYGYDYTNNKTSSYSVRLVRGGQSLGSSSTPINNPPTAPIFISVPIRAAANNAVTITVQAGTDPEGEQVNANCSATHSNYPDTAGAPASLSGLGLGGRNVQHTFTFNAIGEQMIYCTSYDASHNGSSTVSQTITVTAPPTNQPPVAYINVNTPVVGDGDVLRLNVSAANPSNDSAKYDVIIAVVLPNDQVLYDNSVALVTSDSWFARDLAIPETMAWYERLAYTIGSGAPEGNYELYILLVDKNGKLVSSDSSGFEYRKGKGHLAEAGNNDEPKLGKFEPRKNGDNAFQGTVLPKAFLDKAEKVYKFVKKGDELKNIFDKISDISDLLNEINSDSTRLNNADLSEKMAAIRIMFYMLDYCTVGGIRCDLGIGKNLLGGMQQVFMMQAEAGRQWGLTLGLDSVKLAWKKRQTRCLMGHCIGAVSGSVDFYLTPLETCKKTANITWATCASERALSRSEVLKDPANYRILVASNVSPGNEKALGDCFSYSSMANGVGCAGDIYVGWPPGLYLIEAVDPSTGVTRVYNTIMIDQNTTYQVGLQQ